MADFRASSGAFGEREERARKQVTWWLSGPDSNLGLQRLLRQDVETFHWTCLAKEALVVETDERN